MSSTVDTNVLIYASDSGSDRYQPARQLLEQFANGPEIAYLFWPTLVGYVRVVTHIGILTSPLTPQEAVSNLRSLIERPHLRTPGESEGFWQMFADLVAGTSAVRGNLIGDAHIVALMRLHGVKTIWTADRDFRRFEGIEVRDPFRPGRSE